MIPAKPNLGKLKINDNTIEGKKCQLTKKINIAIVISCCEVYAGVVKLADTYDSKSYEVYPSCGFNSHLRHQKFDIEREVKKVLQQLKC